MAIIFNRNKRTNRVNSIIISSSKLRGNRRSGWDRREVPWPRQSRRRLARSYARQVGPERRFRSRLHQVSHNPPHRPFTSQPRHHRRPPRRTHRITTPRTRMPGRPCIMHITCMAPSMVSTLSTCPRPSIPSWMSGRPSWPNTIGTDASPGSSTRVSWPPNSL